MITRRKKPVSLDDVHRELTNPIQMCGSVSPFPGYTLKTRTYSVVYTAGRETGIEVIDARHDKGVNRRTIIKFKDGRPYLWTDNGVDLKIESIPEKRKRSATEILDVIKTRIPQYTKARIQTEIAEKGG